jgi:hypothetical protein
MSTLYLCFQINVKQADHTIFNILVAVLNSMVYSISSLISQYQRMTPDNWHHRLLTVSWELQILFWYIVFYHTSSVFYSLSVVSISWAHFRYWSCYEGCFHPGGLLIIWSSVSVFLLGGGALLHFIYCNFQGSFFSSGLKWFCRISTEVIR